jgi:hypothetical protein
MAVGYLVALLLMSTPWGLLAATIGTSTSAAITPVPQRA